MLKGKGKSYLTTNTAANIHPAQAYSLNIYQCQIQKSAATKIKDQYSKSILDINNHNRKAI